MAATALLTFAPLANPNPNFRNYANKPSASFISCLSSPSPQRRIDLSRRISLLVPFAKSHEESKHSDIEVENKVNEVENESDESQEAWKKTLEAFKEEAIKMKDISQEAYEVYSKKAEVVLKETAETLKIQSEKAIHDMSIVAQEISEEGKIYLSEAAKNSPDAVKDVVETFAASDELKDISEVRDFYLGIPYGAFLAVGGFLSFMLTGSIPAIRFGVILGGALLALSIASLRSWKSGQSSEMLLKGQAAIATVIFVREWRLFCQKRLFSTSLMILISGAALAFYTYRIVTDGNNKSTSSESPIEE